MSQEDQAEQEKKKPWYKRWWVIAIVVVVGLVVIGSLLPEAEDAPEKSSASEPSPREPEPTPTPPPTVSAEGLYQEREANATRYDLKYKGKWVQITGVVEGIDGGEVSLVAGGFLSNVDLHDLSAQEQARADKGQEFTALCKVGDYILGTINLRDCRAAATSEPVATTEPTATTESITATPTATPTPRPPGYSLNNPVEAGGILQGSDGTEISVLATIADARQQIAEENMFNDPPEEGNRFYMIRVEVVYPSGDESISVQWHDFKLIGDNRLVYDPFDQTCGAIPDRLDGEIFGGGRIEGNICFEIPEDEGGLVLIHEPGFGSESRRFLSLEE